MTKFKCPRCKEEDEIKWSASAWNLKDMSINFACNHCNLPLTFNVVFNDNKPKEKIECDTNYIM